jgi:hypothetical protein
MLRIATKRAAGDRRGSRTALRNSLLTLRIALDGRSDYLVYKGAPVKEQSAAILLNLPPHKMAVSDL